MQEIRDILEDIYNNINKESLLHELLPEERQNYYSLTCPECGKKTAYIYKDSNVIVCNRLNKCGYVKSLWDFIQESNNYSNAQTLEELAKIANYELPKNEYNYEKFEKNKEKTNILETALSYFIFLLWNDKESKALNYLKSRGYDEEDIKLMELGYVPSYEKTLNYLIKKNYKKEDIEQVFKWLKLNDNNYKLVIPLKDKLGNLTALFGRIIEKKDLEKYKPISEAEKIKDDFFNIHNAKKEKRITIVEGYLDAMIAQAKGFKGIVATGGASLSTKQIESLKIYQNKNIVLALDNDKAGIEGIVRVIKILANSKVNLFVASDFSPYKDPDEFIINNGIEKFSNLIDKAISSSKWYAEYLTKKYNIENDQEKSLLIEEALDYDSKLPVHKAHEGQDFLNIISQKTNYDIDILIAESEKIQEKIKKDNEINQYKLLLKESSKLLENNEIETLREILYYKPKEIQSNTIKVIEPFYNLNTFIEDLNRTEDGVKTGYPSLDEYLTIPSGAITIVMGKSSHGKTTFLLNMFLRMVEKYDKKTFLFFSYEEEQKFLNVKMINILAQDLINKNNNFTEIMNYIKGRDRFTKRDKIEKAISMIDNYVNQKRLGLIYNTLDIDSLYNQIKLIQNNNELEIGGVFIDYIQRIPINGKFQQRQLELQAISNKILETSIDLSIPIILGAQVNKEVRGIPKDKDVRESGDILNNANLVLSIYNPAKEENNVSLDEKNRVPFKVCIAKSRNTISNNKEIELKLEGSTLKISDPKQE